MIIDYVRMFDRVWSARRLIPPSWWSGVEPTVLAAHLGWLKLALSQAELFVIDNVAEYFYAGTPKEEWEAKDDFPCLAPPFPTFWMEYHRPSRIVSEVTGIRSNDTLPLTMGFLFSVQNVWEEWEQGRAGDYIQHATPQEIATLKTNIEINSALHGETLAAKLNALEKDFRTLNPEELIDRHGFNVAEVALLRSIVLYRALTSSDEARQRAADLVQNTDIRAFTPKWLVRASCYLQLDGGIAGPVYNWCLSIQEDGSLRRNADCGFGAPMAPGATIPPMDTLNGGSPIIFPCLMALTFLHCKNVEQRTIDPPVGTSADHARKHKRPLARYKVLHIQPMVDVIARSGASPSGADQNPLHICRGHFKDYRERGLFGKHKGIYWWDNYVRGRIEKGIVIKDYCVSPSEN